MKDSTRGTIRTWRKRIAKKFAKRTGRPVRWIHHQLVFADTRREVLEKKDEGKAKTRYRKVSFNRFRIGVAYQPVPGAPQFPHATS